MILEDYIKTQFMVMALVNITSLIVYSIYGHFLWLTLTSAAAFIFHFFWYLIYTIKEAGEW